MKVYTNLSPAAYRAILDAARELGRPVAGPPEAAYIPADGRSLWEQQTAPILARMDSADWRIVERGRANRRALLRALHGAGAKLAVGTDTSNPFVIPGFSGHEELGIFVAAGMSSHQALAAATRASAQLMGALGETATIEVGKRAALLVLSPNPLVDIAHARRPAGVMVRGFWIPGAELEASLRRFLVQNSIRTRRDR